MRFALACQAEVTVLSNELVRLCANGLGFHNCLFTFFSEVCGPNNEVFTAIHSLFSFFEGITILSVGPVGTALLHMSPEVAPREYAIGKYKVGDLSRYFIPWLTQRQYLVAYASSMTMASGLLVLVPMLMNFRRSQVKSESK